METEIIKVATTLVKTLAALVYYTHTKDKENARAAWVQSQAEFNRLGRLM